MSIFNFFDIFFDFHIWFLFRGGHIRYWRTGISFISETRLSQRRWWSWWEKHVTPVRPYHDLIGVHQFDWFHVTTATRARHRHSMVSILEGGTDQRQAWAFSKHFICIWGGTMVMMAVVPVEWVVAVTHVVMFWYWWQLVFTVAFCSGGRCAARAAVFWWWWWWWWVWGWSAVVAIIVVMIFVQQMVTFVMFTHSGIVAWFLRDIFHHHTTVVLLQQLVLSSSLHCIAVVVVMQQMLTLRFLPKLWRSVPRWWWRFHTGNISSWAQLSIALDHLLLSWR